jgi:hypothetical protein
VVPAVRLLASGALASITCASLVACAQTPHLDRADVEHHVKATAVSLLPHAKIGTTTCPADEPFRVGVSFTCEVATNGLGSHWQVELTQDKTLLISPIDTVIDVARAQADIASQLAAQSTSALTVDCGREPYRVVGLGATLSCAVKGGTNPTVEAKVVDIAGTVKVTA